MSFHVWQYIIEHLPQVIYVHVYNSAYPTNAYFNTGAPSTLKLDKICGLYETKKCWKFELDISNSSGVTATQNI